MYKDNSSSTKALQSAALPAIGLLVHLSGATREDDDEDATYCLASCLYQVPHAKGRGRRHGLLDLVRVSDVVCDGARTTAVPRWEDSDPEGIFVVGALKAGTESVTAATATRFFAAIIDLPNAPALT